MKVTYLKATDGRRLVKRITPKGKYVTYPQVKNFDSWQKDYATLNEYYQDLEAYIDKGYCQLKGQFHNDLNGESREKKTIVDGLTDRIVLDFDKIKRRLPLPPTFDKKDVEAVASDLLTNLPQEFQRCSFIARASSSYGTDPEYVSIHIEMRLNTPVPPKTLKLLLKQLNLQQGFMRDNLELSNNWLCLKYPLDICLADNARLLLVSAPEFQGVSNPFPTQKDRIVYVQRPDETLDDCVFNSLDENKIRQLGETALKEVRKKNGLRAKIPRTTPKFIGGESIDILTNAEKMNIEIYAVHDEWVHADINGGDSHAYWWYKTNPTIVYNFKNEPCFYMKEVAPDFYRKYKETYKAEILEAHGLNASEEPIVFREPTTDIYYSMIYNSNEDRIVRFAPIGRESIANFLHTWGQDVPDFFPEYDLVFDPTVNTQFDADAKRVNQFRPTKYLRATDLPECLDEPTKYGTCLDAVKNHTPDFYANVLHVLGDSKAEAEHFLNWLACICQKRDKTKTAWILLGRTGTGKGLFVAKFFNKVFGEYCKTAKTDSIDDDKNGFLEDCIILFVDEFKEHDGKNASRLHNIIKQLITDEMIPIRHMRQTTRTVRNYTNFLFASNDLDIMRITEDDRRFNIGTRQGSSIKSIYHDLPQRLDDENQLMRFCQILNTHEIDQYQVEELIENDAKRAVQRASMTAFEMFFFALQEGNLDYFIQHVDYEHSENAMEHERTKDIVHEWMEITEQPSFVRVADLRKVYNFITFKPMDSPKFASALIKKGFQTARRRSSDGSRAETIEVTWKLMDAEDALARVKKSAVRPIGAVTY